MDKKGPILFFSHGETDKKTRNKLQEGKKEEEGWILEGITIIMIDKGEEEGQLRIGEYFFIPSFPSFPSFLIPSFLPSFYSFFFSLPLVINNTFSPILLFLSLPSFSKKKGIAPFPPSQNGL